MVNDGTSPGPELPDYVDNPGTGVDFTALPGGTTASNQLPAETADAYRVSNTAGLELASLTGDADLYVFDSPNLSEESLVCSSMQPTGVIDSCEVVGDGDRFVVVFAFSAVEY